MRAWYRFSIIDNINIDTVGSSNRLCFLASRGFQCFQFESLPVADRALLVEHRCRECSA